VSTGAATRRENQVHRALGGLFIEIEHLHMSALLRKKHGDGLTDAGTRSGDDDVFILKGKHALVRYAADLPLQYPRRTFYATNWPASFYLSF
jgi:hypothetical protein